MAALGSEVRALRQSTSWRLTAPIRHLKDALLRVGSNLRRSRSSAAESRDVDLIAGSGLFDADYYAAQTPHLGGSVRDLIVHYLHHGATERRDPHPLFDTAFYLAQNPHVVALGVNPLVHFLKEGPTPAFDPLSAEPPLPETGICIVTPDIVGPVKNGGIGTACYHFARVLAERGDRVTILFTCELSPCRQAHWRNAYARMGIKFVPLADTPPASGEVVGSTWFMERSWRVFKYLEGRSYDVIHFQDWHANGFWSIKAKQVGLAFAERTLTVMTHSPTKWQDDGMQHFGSEPVETAKLAWAEAYAIEHCDVLLSPTRYMLDWLAEQRMRTPPTVLVTPLAYTGSARAGGVPPNVDHDHLLFFGRLETRKGLHVFGEALRRLRREGKSLPRTVSFLGTLVTVNGRPAAEYLAELREDLAPTEIRVIDDLDHAGAHDYIERSRGLVVIPSLVDNCPLVVIECIENRFPFLAARTGGIPGMVDPKATFAPTPADLAARLAERHGIDYGGMRHPYSVGDARTTWLELHGDRGLLGGRRTALPVAGDPDEMPRVSVCVPFCTHGDHLETLVAALEAERYPDLEIVVVNDGSGAEDSREFDRLAARARAGRWQFVTTENRGTGAARNRAAEAATGDLLLFLDADALPKSRDFVGTMVRALRRSGADCVTCAYDVVGADRVVPGAADVLCTYRPWGPCLAAGFVQNLLGDSVMIVRRTAFARVGAFPEKRPSWEAHEFLLRLSFQGLRLETVPEALVYVRRDGPIGDHPTNPFLHFQSLFEQLRDASSHDLAHILATVAGPTLAAKLGTGLPGSKPRS